ncbi:MAG: lipid kinase [Bacteroidaceae bacterium]|nr:lipid kinase [Bacteroidaceae bacterium]MBR5883833.1 lipid kinase [Bacteroidaceae bacterium]
MENKKSVPHNATRWGIVYCPKPGVMHPHKCWEQVREYMENKGLEYDFVQSDGAGSVERLTSMLVRNGYTTLIVVGGDRALGQALNALMAEEKAVRDQICLGIIPNGRGNDFAHFWGISDENLSHCIDVLVRHKIRRVDVGKCQWETEEGAQGMRYFMNCVNVGLAAHIMEIKHRAPRFWRLGFVTRPLRRLSILFKRISQHLCIRVNQNVVDQSVMTMCIGNAHGYGQTPGAVPYNGLLDVSIVSHPKMLQLVNGLWLLLVGRFLNHPNVKAFRTREKIQVTYNEPACTGIDGNVINENVKRMEVSVCRECLNFIVP